VLLDGQHKDRTVTKEAIIAPNRQTFVPSEKEVLGMNVAKSDRLDLASLGTLKCRVFPPARLLWRGEHWG